MSTRADKSIHTKKLATEMFSYAKHRIIIHIEISLAITRTRVIHTKNKHVKNYLV